MITRLYNTATKISGKFLIFLFILTHIIYFLMLFWTIPNLMQMSGGLQIFDLKPMGHTFQDALKLLENLGTEGRLYYVNKQLVLDLFYPLGYGLTYSIGGVWLFHRIVKTKILGYTSLVTSLLAASCDYLENFHIYKLLKLFPSVTLEDIQTLNQMTLLKSVFNTIAICLFLIAFLIYLIKGQPSPTNS